jgi:hypothetical protein
LPYGDERPTVRRRRADSDVESAGSGRLVKVCFLCDTCHQVC